MKEGSAISNVGTPGYRDVPVPAWDPAAPIDAGEAEEFLRQYYQENPGLGSAEPRWREVRAEIDRTGTYQHTSAELTYGAKLAWRNASRCIGRLYWRSMFVLDQRAARTPDELFAAVVQHLDTATGNEAAGSTRRRGAIRPVISIFAPAVPGEPFPRIWNEQLIRYAGYPASGGTVIGDPLQLKFTATLQGLGWTGKGTAFDVLPVAIETPEHGVRLYDLPESAVLEVELTHPEYEWFAELELRWYAVPAVANQRLTIGGIHYPMAPFNGWYMGTEIGARNLADPDRYDLLAIVGERLQLDMSSETTLWRDRALIEMNRAVLHSFGAAGVQITDHHTESARFLEHVSRERKAGREVPADWSWIVPPLSGGATPVFHRYYFEADQRPNFYLDEQARLLVNGG